jgi:hypothetical protein
MEPLYMHNEGGENELESGGALQTAQLAYQRFRLKRGIIVSIVSAQRGFVDQSDIRRGQLYSFVCLFIMRGMPSSSFLYTNRIV